MVIESRNAGIVSREDNRRLLFVQHYDWALKMTFRYLGEYEAAVATVHNAFLRLFQSDGRGQLFDRKPLEKIFVRAAVNAALQRGDDTIPAREGHAKTYLRQLAVCDSKTADLSKYRNAIGQLLLLPLYPRLAYNLCVVEDFSSDETAALLGINESEVGDQLKTARMLLKNAIQFLK